MASFQSAMLSPKDWKAQNKKAIRLMNKVGAQIPADWFSSGVPQLCLIDLTNPEAELRHFSGFKNRIILGEGSGFNSLDVSPFPHGPVRITLVRWGKEEDHCGRLIIGKQSSLNGTSVVSYLEVWIGDNVLFGPQVVIMDCDGHPADRRLTDSLSNSNKAPVRIEDYAWIGYNAVIMKGVTIGHHAVVAANAVVTKSVPPHCVAAGNPAKIIRDYSTTQGK